MRVLVLTPYLYDTAPGPRTSIELWERVLKPEGISFEYVPFESQRLHEIIYAEGRQREKAREMLAGLVRRIGLMRRIGEFDAVLIYREAALLGPAIFERWVAGRGKPIIYQLDDPLYVPYRSPSNGYLSYLKFFGKVKAIVRMSTVVIVNSPQHREFAAPLNANVWEIPSLVDEKKFMPRPRNGTGNQRVCVGWSGSATTISNLRTIQGVLRDLGRQPNVELRFIGSPDFKLPDVFHSATPWRADSEVEDLRRFDVGLVPLPANEWNKRKFYVKLIQYMSLGIAPVATPLGANPHVIDHGRTGFLASSERDWREALDRLVGDSELRLSVGQAAARVARPDIRSRLTRRRSSRPSTRRSATGDPSLDRGASRSVTTLWPVSVVEPDTARDARTRQEGGEIVVTPESESARGRSRFIGARSLQYAVLFVNALLVVRALGPVGRARYVLPITLATAVWTVVYLSLDLATERIVARREASLEALTQALAAAVIVISVFGVGAAVALGLLGHGALVGGASAQLVLLAALMIPALAVQTFAGSVLLIVGDLRRYGSISVVAALAQLFGTTVLVVAGGMTPSRAVALIVFGFATSAGLMLWMVVRHLGATAVRPRIERSIAPRLLRIGIATHPLSLAIQLGGLLDLLIVGALVSARRTGLYSLAVTLADSAMLASLALAQTSVHPLTRKGLAEAVEFNVKFSRESFHFAIVAATAVAIGAYPFVVVVYGPEWAGAVVPFIIITLGFAAVGIENPSRLLLLRVASPAKLSLLACVGVGINAGLTVVLVEPLGIIGASLATLCSVWLYTAAVLTMLRRHGAGVPVGELIRWPARNDLVRQVPRALHQRISARRSSSSP